MTPSDERRLLILLPYRLSEIVAKGEIVPRYFNPGDVFTQVDVVMMVEDEVDPLLVAPLVGGAELGLHLMPVPRTLSPRTLVPALRTWLKPFVELAESLRPGIVRCHGAYANVLVAREIGRRLGIPYVVSLHVNVDEDAIGRAATPLERLRLRAIDAVATPALRDADLVLPVYEPIVPYLERRGVTRYEVAYNVIGADRLHTKHDYGLHRPVRVVSTGRIFEHKNPENLIRAVGELDGVELLVVGDGPLRPALEALAGPQVRFAPALPNAELCALLADQDIFATHTEYWELSKSVLEPLLTGLPVILNRRVGRPVPELEDVPCVFVENTVEGYRDALLGLIGDDGRREALGRAARTHAVARWGPARTEARFAAIYGELMGGPSG